MIKEIFLPEKIGHHRILSQKIVGVLIRENDVQLAYTNVKRHGSTLEKLVSEPIEQGSPETAPERISHAIKKIMHNVSDYDQIRACVPASIVIFKDIILQFTDPEKIRMVLEYEVETMLPFSVSEAIVDFIITKTEKEPQQANVLVAAVRNQDLQNYLMLYQAAGIDPTSMTIDLFALYGLYLQIPAYKNLAQSTALVDIGSQSTRIAFIQQGQLRLSRYIQQGFASIVHSICSELSVTEEVVSKQLAHGLRPQHDNAIARSAQKYYIQLLNDIQFTLNSFSMKLNANDGISKVLFTHGDVHIPDLMKFCSDTIQIPCETFDTEKLFETSLIKNKVHDAALSLSDFATVVGVALPLIEHSDFNFRRKQFAFQQNKLILRQLGTVVGITLGILLLIGAKGYFDLGSLASEARNLELREINRIKAENIFTKEQYPKKPTMQNVVREAEKIVQEKLELWAPFAQQRMRPLELWLELTRIIDKKQFDVSIKEVTFTTEEKGWEREKDGTVKKDAGIPKFEVEGLFKSKTGDHWGDFITFLNRFRESNILKFIEQYEETPAPDGGVNFTIRMRLKEA
jgi:Tfp pilus assembly PilM family ATPase